MNEHGLKHKVHNALTRRKRDGMRIWWFKVAGGLFQRVGIPDFLLCVGGVFVAVEIKSPTEQPVATPAQQRVLELIREAGGLVLVSNELDQVMAFVDAISAWPIPTTAGSVAAKVLQGYELRGD